MNEFLDGFVSKLKPRIDRADGADWTSLEKALPAHVTLPTPLCLYRTEKILNRETGEEIDRIIWIMETVCIHAHVMAQKINPEITLEEVSRGITPDNREQIIDDIYSFWLDVDLRAAEEEEGLGFDANGESENPIPAEITQEQISGET